MGLGLVMTIALPEAKLHNMQKMCWKMAWQEVTSLRELARLLVASHPAILPAPLHYRCLERIKYQALWKGLLYETEVQVDAGMMNDLRCWQDKSSRHNGRTLQVSQWDVTIESDVSMMGWRASCQDMPTGGPGGESKQHKLPAAGATYWQCSWPYSHLLPKGDL